MRSLRCLVSLVVVTLLAGSTAQANWSQPPTAPRSASPAEAGAPADTSAAPAAAPAQTGAPPGSAPSAASSSPSAPRPPSPTADGPSVRLRTNNSHARLQQQLDLSWTDVCAPPCGRTVDPNGTYRLGGGTLRPTDPFRMPRPAGVVLVTGTMGSNVKHWVGFALALGGVVDAASGALTIVYARNKTGNFSQDLSNKDYFTAVGIIGIATGAILTGIGTYLFATGSSSAEIQ